MCVLKRLGELAFWFALWMGIPAALLYPIALWLAKHSRISVYAVAKGYSFAIALLFLPTGFLVDYAYRRFIRDRRTKRPESPGGKIPSA